MNLPTGRLVLTSALGTLILGGILFLSAGTFSYWQGWVFLAVWVASTQALGIYLFIFDPALLERRMQFGPRAETDPRQRAFAALAIVAALALLVVPALDRRFGWSDVPTWVSVIGDVLVAVSFGMFFAVMRENTFGASNIQVIEGQRVIATGPYALVRHPMYAGVVVMMVGVVLALGSWWGLLIVVLGVVALVFRLTNEEMFLARSLAGYTDYMNRVRYRLLPGLY